MNIQLKNVEKKKREVWLDIARVIAILSISMNHAYNRSFFSYFIDTEYTFEQFSILFSILKAIICVFSRLGVPLFVMITGALLLKRDYSKKENLLHFLKHNYLTLVIATEVWMQIYLWVYIFIPDIQNNSFVLLDAITTIVKTVFFINLPVVFLSGSLWYMYMILSVYLLIPMISIFIHTVDKSYIRLIFAAVFLIAFLMPTLQVVIPVIFKEHTIRLPFEECDLMSKYCVYLLAGYYISDGILSKLKSKHLFLLTFLFYVLDCIFQFIYFFMNNMNRSMDYTNVGIFIVSVLFFEFIRRISVTKKITINVFEVLSRESFGIYFVHIVIMEFLFSVIKGKIMFFSSFFLLEAVSFLGSVLIITVFSKIPFLKKYLFYCK